MPAAGATSMAAAHLRPRAPTRSTKSQQANSNPETASRPNVRHKAQGPGFRWVLKAAESRTVAALGAHVCAGRSARDEGGQSAPTLLQQPPPSEANQAREVPVVGHQQHQQPNQPGAGPK